jgi:hypothetical protein
MRAAAPAIADDAHATDRNFRIRLGTFGKASCLHLVYKARVRFLTIGAIRSCSRRFSCFLPRSPFSP